MPTASNPARPALIDPSSGDAVAQVLPVGLVEPNSHPDLPWLPPVSLLFAYAPATALHLIAPWTLRLVAASVGWFVMVLTAVLALWAMVEFWRARTSVSPRKSTTRLVTLRGPYQFSRNPLYVALVGLGAGIAMVNASIWFLAAIPVHVWLLRRFIIEPEEQFLAAKFGPEYRAYAKHVRRWL